MIGICKFLENYFCIYMIFLNSLWVFCFNRLSLVTLSKMLKPRFRTKKVHCFSSVLRLRHTELWILQKSFDKQTLEKYQWHSLFCISNGFKCKHFVQSRKHFENYICQFSLTCCLMSLSVQADISFVVQRVLSFSNSKHIFPTSWTFSRHSPWPAEADFCW